MCIRKHFYHAHCRHTVVKTYMCGYGVCRVPSHEIHHSHPGECLDCLGGNNTWPLENYKVETTKTNDNSSELKAYAQVMLDLLVCFLISNCAGADQYQGQAIFSEPDLARTVATVILRARFFENRCRACGESTFDGGDLSCGCPAALAPIGTQNPARQCHLRVVHDANLDTFLQQLPSGEIDLIKRQIAAAHQPGCLMPDIAHSLILRPFPLPSDDTLARVPAAGNAVKALVNDLQTLASGILPVEVHRYTELSDRLLYYVASWMMVNDSGLQEPQMVKVLHCLAPCLIYPQGDPRRPPSWTPYFCLDYTAYQYCVGAFMFRFSDSSVELLQQHINQFKNEVVYPIAARHNTALDSMQQTKKDFYDARLSYYTTHVDDLGAGEEEDECPICMENYQCGATGDDEILKTKKCKHKFHRECLRRSLMSAARNRWGCPYCRQSVDDLQPDDIKTKFTKDKWWGYEGKLA